MWLAHVPLIFVRAPSSYNSCRYVIEVLMKGCQGRAGSSLEGALVICTIYL